jgi:hypothetical protein
MTKTTTFTAHDAEGKPYRWAFWYDSAYRAWFLRDYTGYVRRMESNWYGSVPRIKLVLENHGMTAEVS